MKRLNAHDNAKKLLRNSTLHSFFYQPLDLSSNKTLQKMSNEELIYLKLESQYLSQRLNKEKIHENNLQAIAVSFIPAFIAASLPIEQASLFYFTAAGVLAYNKARTRYNLCRQESAKQLALFLNQEFNCRHELSALSREYS